MFCGLVSNAVGLLSVSCIGHKIKSVNNPDLRVELVKEYASMNFPSYSLLGYALAVGRVTTAKKDTVCCLLLFYFIIFIPVFRLLTMACL